MIGLTVAENLMVANVTLSDRDELSLLTCEFICRRHLDTESHNDDAVHQPQICYYC